MYIKHGILFRFERFTKIIRHHRVSTVKTQYGKRQLAFHGNPGITVAFYVTGERVAVGSQSTADELGQLIELCLEGVAHHHELARVQL